MPEQNEQKKPQAPTFNPKVKETIAAFKEDNSPKNLNNILNELVRSPLLAPAVFDLQGQPAPKPDADGFLVNTFNGTHLSLLFIQDQQHVFFLPLCGWGHSVCHK